MAVKLVGHEKKEKKKAEVMTPQETLRVETRLAFRDFQACWFSFAKKIAEIRHSEAWRAYGFDDFKNFCKEEYPDLSYGTICKFTTVVEHWGSALDQRLLKAPDEPLPGFEACYEVAIVEDRLPKEDVPKLRKGVLERKLTRYEVREQLKDYRRKKVGVISDKEKKKLDAEVDKAEKKVKEDTKAITDSLDVVKDVKAKQACTQILARIKLGFQALGDVTGTITEPEPEAIELAEYLRDNIELINEQVDAYLAKIVEITEEEGE